MKKNEVKTLFLDIGGVLLTDGWGRNQRSVAYEHFELEADKDQIDERHEMNFDTYEMGRMSLDKYLDNAVFYKKRKFSRDEFVKLMLKQSKPLPGAIDFFADLKKNNNLKVIAVSNEARELNEHRIKTFKLHNIFDAFVSSCYVGMRKPDPQMYKMASDISFTPYKNALYIDDRIIYIESARNLGVPSLHYTGIEPAKLHFEKLGLK